MSRADGRGGTPRPRPPIRLRPVPQFDPPFDDELEPEVWAARPPARLRLVGPRPVQRRPTGGDADTGPAGRQIRSSDPGPRSSGRPSRARAGQRHGTSTGGQFGTARTCVGRRVRGREARRPQFVAMCVEVLNGYRPAAHLRRLSRPGQAAGVVAQALAAAHGSPTCAACGSRSRPARGTPRRPARPAPRRWPCSSCASASPARAPSRRPSCWSPATAPGPWRCGWSTTSSPGQPPSCGWSERPAVAESSAHVVSSCHGLGAAATSRRTTRPRQGRTLNGASRRPRQGRRGAKLPGGPPMDRGVGRPGLRAAQTAPGAPWQRLYFLPEPQ